MDRADVIIFGGGLVGLALAAALDCSGLSAIVVDPADPAKRARRQRSTAAPARVSSSSMRMLDTIGVADHFPEPGCPIRRSRSPTGSSPAASLRAGRRRRAARLDAREPPSARRAAGPGRGRASNRLAAVEVARRRRSSAATHGVIVSAGRRPQAVARRCWSPPTGAIRRRARRPGSASPAGSMIMRRSSRCCATSGRTTMSPTKSSIPTGPFALLPMTDDERRAPLGDRLVGAAGRRAGLAVAERRGFRRRGARRRWAASSARSRMARAALDLSARLPPCGADHRPAAGAGRRCRARHPPDRRPGPQPRLPRRRRAGAGAGRRRAARPRPRRPAIARPLPALAQRSTR